jgi:hypothetical protein
MVAVEASVEMLAALCFFVTGVSHVAQPRAWAEFFIEMRGRGVVGSFQNALLHFPLGAIIVSLHNVWTGLPLILTLIGWGLVFKSLLYFTLPKYGLKKGLGMVSVEKSSGFVVAGVFAIALGGLFAYLALRR